MFEIYGRNNCVWCDRAKALLDEKGLTYKYMNIEENENYLEAFKENFPGAKTVPQIIKLDWYDVDEWIGGYEDLHEWLKLYTVKS